MEQQQQKQEHQLSVFTSKYWSDEDGEQAAKVDEEIKRREK